MTNESIYARNGGNWITSRPKWDLRHLEYCYIVIQALYLWNKQTKYNDASVQIIRGLLYIFIFQIWYDFLKTTKIICLKTIRKVKSL